VEGGNVFDASRVEFVVRCTFRGSGVEFLLLSHFWVTHRSNGSGETARRKYG
jgi:hypothetical protein